LKKFKHTNSELQRAKEDTPRECPTGYSFDNSKSKCIKIGSKTGEEA